MDMNVCLAIVIGYLSVAKAQNRFCSGGLCFIRPDPNSGKAWLAAQQMCKDNNSTLPIADNTNSQMSYTDALNYFQLNGMDVWLGANASDKGMDHWQWLDRSQYSNPEKVQERGEYYKSYAYVAMRTDEVLAYASAPNVSYSYICQCSPDGCTNGTGRTAFVMENKCFMRFDEKLPWFNARNKCLEKSCDLASFSQLSLLDGVVDSNGFWVGLRASQWNWQNAVTGLSSDVTYTSWGIGQPNDAAPDCMATHSVLDKGSASTSSSHSTTTPTTTKTSESSRSITASTTTTTSPLETHVAAKTDTGSSNTALAIGLGVGLGVPVIIVVVVIAVVLRRKHQNRLLGRDGANIEPEIANSKQTSASSSNSVLPRVGSDANDHYQQLKNSHELQEQQQYEELQQSPQYEQLQRSNELQEQQQYEQLPQAPQYEQL